MRGAWPRWPGSSGATGTPSTTPSSPMAQPWSTTPDRFGAVEALGLDEVLMVEGADPGTARSSPSQLVDVGRGQLLDVVPGRSSTEPMVWLAKKGKAWCDQVRFATLDLSGPYRKVFTLMTPGATQVADPFHLVKLAHTKLDECRRRVQNGDPRLTAATSPTPSIGPDACSPRRRSNSTKEDTRSWSGCFVPAIPTVTWPPSGKRRRPSGSSMPTPIPSSPSSG